MQPLCVYDRQAIALRNGTTRSCGRTRSASPVWLIHMLKHGSSLAHSTTTGLYRTCRPGL